MAVFGVPGVFIRGESGVAVLTINRCERRNALDRAMKEALDSARQTSDHRNAVLAFLNKDRPTFRGV